MRANSVRKLQQAPWPSLNQLLFHRPTAL